MSSPAPAIPPDGHAQGFANPAEEVQAGNPLGRADKEGGMFAQAVALTAAIELASVAGHPYSRNVDDWRAARERLIGAVNLHLWDPKRSAFVDSLHSDESLSPVSSQATNAAMVVYGVAAGEGARQLARRIMSSEGGLLPYGSPYGLYYLLEMLDGMGDVETLFQIVRQRWGAMALGGDTCTWETFAEFGHDDWPTRSRCHPFAAYVAKYMAKYVLGVRMLEPGYATFRVEPRPPMGVTRCQGAVPTPQGLIRAGWEMVEGKIRLRVEHPKGLRRV